MNALTFTTARFASTLLMALVAACSGVHLEVPLTPPRHSLGKTGLRVAVAPFADARGQAQDGMSAWIAVPFVPWTTGSYDRPDESYVSPGNPDHFEAQLTRVVRDQLAASRLFARVELVDGAIDPAAYDLVVTGELRESRKTTMRTTYGLTVAGFALWLLGAPIGWNAIDWEIDIHVVTPSDRRKLKTVRLAEHDKRWRGLYWGADGTPEDEAQTLATAMAKLVHELDRALEDVPELAALTARPAVAQTSSGGPVPVAIDSVLVLPEAAPSASQQAFLDVLTRAIADRVTGRVVGLADLNAVLEWEHIGQLMGCADAACYRETSAIAEPTAILRVRFATLGGGQTATLTLLAGDDTRVVHRTTWRATGEDPYALAVQAPAMADELLGRWSSEAVR